MRYAKIIVGLILIAKGVADCIRLPVALTAAHAHGGLLAGHAESGLTAGEAAGRILGFEIGIVAGALVILIGGVLLVASAWRREQDPVAKRVAS
jgi:hypothetical protein